MAIYKNITREDYNKLPGINASRLKNYIKSSAHGLFEDSKERKETDAMKFGTMVHSMVLEPHLFPKLYELMPECPEELWICKSGPNKGNRAKAKPKAVTEWEKNLPSDKIYYNVENRDLLERIQSNIDRHKLATELLNDCPNREMAVTWEKNGVKFKALIDMQGGDIVADLKTTKEIPVRFDVNGDFCSTKTAEAIKWKLLVETGNVLQAYHYYEGCLVNDLPVERFKFLFVENNGACNVAVANVTPETLMIGKKQRNRALYNFINRYENNNLFNEEIKV